MLRYADIKELRLMCSEEAREDDLRAPTSNLTGEGRTFPAGI